MAKIDELFRMMIEHGASDLHLIAGQVPAFRIHGELERLPGNAILDNQGLHDLLYEITPALKKDVFESTGDVDFGYEIPGVARFRSNFFNHKHGIGAVFRKIPTTILSAEDLALPPVLTRAAMLRKGLVLVTGPTGSGKSTTLAAMVDYANRHRKDHILTVEDPIEFVHQSKNCIVNHREVGLHTVTFGSALRGALREDPDIILVGEMRDLETIALAVEAAATGHLVFGTLHTENAAKTVDRIIEVFPASEQPQIRNTLSTALRVIVAQNLFSGSIKRGAVRPWKFWSARRPSAISYETPKPFRSRHRCKPGKISACRRWMTRSRISSPRNGSHQKKPMKRRSIRIALRNSSRPRRTHSSNPT
jgi:twitching motility protein PilT